MPDRLSLATHVEADVAGESLIIVPLVNERSLVELIHDFEQGQAFDPVGGYNGLIPDHFDFGDLSAYYLAANDRQWPKPGHAWLLGCDCGEVGCWPLTARIEVADDVVTWTEFSQEHRPDRNYSDFGPFVFDRTQYESAVAHLVERVRPSTTW